MSRGLIERIAKAVLYEGYMLYPYRPSAVKNQLRFNFGVLYPRAYAGNQTGSDNWEMQTEVLLQGSGKSALEVTVRFLQLVKRSVLQALTLGEKTTELKYVDLHPVARLEVDGQLFQSWEEAVEREVIIPVCSVDELLAEAVQHPAAFVTERTLEPIHDSAGNIAGAVARNAEELTATAEVSAHRMADGLFKIRVRTTNTTALADALPNRERALLHSLISTHTILHVQEGEFISALEPPEAMRELVASCVNSGTFPVLVGENGERDTVLSSPIILYDYPQIAPESAGDLFDGTEIDEILSLRIMTMTDEEKHEMRHSDERARQILERTEALPLEQMMKLHGVLRTLHPEPEKKVG